MNRWWAAVLAWALGAAPPGFAADATSVLEARFFDDRTGVCVLAAVIEPARVERTRYCAKPRPAPAYEDAFEIGSVSKTMLAFLIAELVEQGKWSLDDPIAKHLPQGSAVPQQGARQILVRDLLTHSAGLPPLPSRLRVENPADPYAKLTEADVLESLGEATLAYPIGSDNAYSNFGYLVLSLAVARALGSDVDQALRRRLFEPLGMARAHAGAAPAGVKAAPGHSSLGTPVPPWTIAPALAGVGMVRAALDDMVKYAQAHLGIGAAPLQGPLRATHKPLVKRFGMAWLTANVKGRELVMHEGATGGFSALVALEPARQRGVVLLADTALGDLGGLGDVGSALLGLDTPVGKPRLAVFTPLATRDAMVGEYLIDGRLLRVRADGERVLAQAAGQREFELLLDSRGDFYAADGSLLLTPEIADGKATRLTLRQGGGVMQAVRADPAAIAAAERAKWQDLIGEYALAQGFVMRVFEQDGKLRVQGSGQPAIDADLAAPDRIELRMIGAVIEFRRNPRGEVTGATLRQAGQVIDGAKR
jgi:CubicO group peptidase (beta-lactamase class C family)